MILKNNEEKRSTLWRAVLSVSSVIIIIIAVFFVVKLFTGNPLKGSWINEDTGTLVEIRDDGELLLSGTDENGQKAEESAVYNVDTKNKIFTVYADTEYAEGVLSGSYDYSIEADTLTLTEREYGDQMTFVRK